MSCISHHITPELDSALSEILLTSSRRLWQAQWWWRKAIMEEESPAVLMRCSLLRAESPYQQPSGTLKLGRISTESKGLVLKRVTLH